MKESGYLIGDQRWSGVVDASGCGGSMTHRCDRFNRRGVGCLRMRGFKGELFEG